MGGREKREVPISPAPFYRAIWSYFLLPFWSTDYYAVCIIFCILLIMKSFLTFKFISFSTLYTCMKTINPAYWIDWPLFRDTWLKFSFERQRCPRRGGIPSFAMEYVSDGGQAATTIFRIASDKYWDRYLGSFVAGPKSM